MLPRKLLFALATAFCLKVPGFGQDPSPVGPAYHQGAVPDSVRRLPADLAAVRPAFPLKLDAAPARPAGLPPRSRGPLTGMRRKIAIPDRHVSRATLPDGSSIAVLSIVSPGAMALRVHFSGFDAGEGQVWVYRPGSQTAVAPYSGQGVFGDGDFWSAPVDGDEIVVAYVGESAEEALPFVIDSVAHQWEDPLRAAAAAEAPCNLDVSCYSAYSDLASAVAMFAYIGDDGGSYVCSGVLLNTRDSSFKPYFLTANHCVSTATEARSVAAYFRYQTLSCNGAPPSLSSATLVLGATYLAGGDITQGDYAFLLLNRAPGDAYYLGWDPGTLDATASVTGIHHPRGPYTRISFGARSPDRDVMVEGQTGPASLYYRVAWSNGVTEPGSSGSPLLNSSGHVLGTLTSGPIIPPDQNACTVERAGAYGRFSNVYRIISPWLEDAPIPSLSVSTANLSFTVRNSAAPTAQSISVTTSSLTPLTLGIDNRYSWMTVTGNPSVSSTSPATLRVEIKPGGLVGPGPFSGSFRISAGSATPVNVFVQVTQVVVDSVVTVSVSPNPVYQQSPDADGYSWFYTVRVTESAGVGTQITAFRAGSTDFSSELSKAFGATSLTAYGTLSSSIRGKYTSIPLTQSIEVEGRDYATSRTWRASTQMTALGPRGQPSFTLSSDLTTVRQNPGAASDCQWSHQLTLRETAGYGAQLTRFTAGTFDLSGQVAKYFGSARISPGGTLTARLCWPSLTAPTNMVFVVEGVGDNGARATAQTQVSFLGPLVNPGRLTASPSSLNFSGSSESLLGLGGQVKLDFAGATVSWTAALTLDGHESPWITAYPLSGSGSNATINLTVYPNGFTTGRYQALLRIQAPNATPQLLDVPILIQINPEQILPPPTLSPGGLVNGASFQAGAVPGMLMSIFGNNFGRSAISATAAPLPLSLGGVSVTIGGSRAPLYFVAPNQINVQVPVELVPGPAQVVVNVDGQTATQTVQISPSLPGIFTAGGRLVPSGTARPGDYLVLFVTGYGQVAPSVATGNAPPSGATIDQLPQPVLPVRVSVGGVPAPILFAGIPPGLVGVAQINFQAPANAPPGNQAVVVTIGEQPSPAAKLEVLE